MMRLTTVYPVMFVLMATLSGKINLCLAGLTSYFLAAQGRRGGGLGAVAGLFSGNETVVIIAVCSIVLGCCCCCCKMAMKMSSDSDSEPSRAVPKYVVRQTPNGSQIYPV